MNSIDNYTCDINIFFSRVTMNLPPDWVLLDYSQLNLTALQGEIAGVFAVMESKQQRIYIPKTQPPSVFTPTIIIGSGFYPYSKKHDDLLVFYTQLSLPDSVVDVETFTHDTMTLSFITVSYTIENTSFSTRNMLLTRETENDNNIITEVVSLVGTWLTKESEVGMIINEVFNTMIICEPITGNTFDCSLNLI